MHDTSLIAKRVLIVGAHWGQTDHIDELIRRAFIQLGCLVETFDYQANPHFHRRRGTPWIMRLLRQMFSTEPKSESEEAYTTVGEQRFIGVVNHFRPELVLVLRGEKLPASAIHYARNKDAYTLNWIVDAPWRYIPEALVPVYDCWAVADRKWHAWLLNHGAGRVRELPLAADPEMHYPVELSDAERGQWASEVCFVGSYSEAREAMLAPVTRHDLAIWGPGWELARDAQVKQCVRSTQRLSREAWLKAYSAAEVVLNIQNEGESGLSLRVWESLSAGACLLSNSRQDIGTYLEDLVETYERPDDLAAKVNALLSNEIQRRKMRRSCREYIVAYHSFRHRAETLMDWMQEDQAGERKGRKR